LNDDQRPAAPPDHPAMRSCVDDVEEWDPWFDLWIKATTFIARVGLIHAAWNLELQLASDRDERLRFFLQLADHWWADPHYFRPADREFVWEVGDRRKQLATLGFKGLAKHVFKPAIEDTRSLHALASSEHLPRILDFFAVDLTAPGPRIPNLGWSPPIIQARWARDFLLALTSYGLVINPSADFRPPPSRFELYGDDYVFVLAALGELDRLLSGDMYNRLPQSAWQGLRQLALGELGYDEPHGSTTLAVRAGSQAAAVYTILGIRRGALSVRQLP